MAVKDYYKVQGDSVTRIKQFCPRCGPGTFLADHKNRLSCGKCGYTEFKKYTHIKINLTLFQPEPQEIVCGSFHSFSAFTHFFIQIR